MTVHVLEPLRPQSLQTHFSGRLFRLIRREEAYRIDVLIITVAGQIALGEFLIRLCIRRNLGRILKNLNPVALMNQNRPLSAAWIAQKYPVPVKRCTASQSSGWGADKLDRGVRYIVPLNAAYSVP